MLLDILLTKYCWLMMNIPRVIHSYYSWNRWFNGLTSHDLAKFMNYVRAIEFSKSMIENEFNNYLPDSKEFEFTRYTYASYRTFVSG